MHLTLHRWAGTEPHKPQAVVPLLGLPGVQSAVRARKRRAARSGDKPVHVRRIATDPRKRSRIHGFAFFDPSHDLDTRSEKPTFVHTVITPEQREALVRAIESGQPLNQAAKSLGIPRSSIYAERSRDLAFARQIDDARDASRSEPVRALVPYDSDEPLPRDLIGRFCKALYATESIQLAAREAGIDLFPRRVKPADLSRKSRALIRALLDSIDEGPDPEEMSPAQRAKWAVDRWMAGEPWPEIELDWAEVRAISKRASRDFERELMVRAAQKAANEPGDAAE